MDVLERIRTKWTLPVITNRLDELMEAGTKTNEAELLFYLEDILVRQQGLDGKIRQFLEESLREGFKK
jgi:hypothetical protein